MKCAICQLKKVDAQSRYCADCLEAAKDSQSWQSKLMELDKKSLNYDRRQLRPRKGAKQGFIEIDPTPAQLEAKQQDMDDVLDSLASAMGRSEGFPPGFLDMMEKYNPAVKHIQQILSKNPSLALQEAMIIQFYEIVIDYLKNTPEEFDKRGDGHKFANWRAKADDPRFVFKSYNAGQKRQRRPDISWATFKRRLSEARKTLKDYEKNTEFEPN